MLWIGGELETTKIISHLFLPSIACLIVAIAYLSLSVKGKLVHPEKATGTYVEPMSRTIFWLGMGCLVFVPVLKALTGLPPFMGIIFGLAIMWLFTDIVHSQYTEKSHLKVPYIITKIDMSSVLFFLGILLTIDALHTAGLLEALAKWMTEKIGNPNLIAIAIGLASAVVDNVPLVAAVMGMYDLTEFAPSSSFWDLVAFCAGTGGSILVIGSAAGVAFMGMEKVSFFWYLRRVGLAALLGFFAGIGVYLLS